jgi:hypothetical protein
MNAPIDPMSVRKQACKVRVDFLSLFFLPLFFAITLRTGNAKYSESVDNSIR